MTSYSHIAHLSTSSFLPPLDLHPIYPTAAVLSQSLDSSSTLTPLERTTLVNHSLSRACSFANLSLLTFLLKDERCNRWVELEGRDEDGATAVTVCIMGFRGAVELENGHQGHGEESDVEREMEREECVRLLVHEGADLTSTDNCMLNFSEYRLRTHSLDSWMDTSSPCRTFGSNVSHILYAFTRRITSGTLSAQAHSSGRNNGVFRHPRS